jgi:hypothetical protein
MPYNWAAMHVLPTRDSGALFLASFMNKTTGIRVIKMDKNGNVEIPENLSYKFRVSDYNIYPNPANTKLNITKGEQIKYATLKIFDINGKNILTQKLSDKNTMINVSALPNGIYFYKILDNNNNLETGKIIIAH